jgi:transposase
LKDRRPFVMNLRVGRGDLSDDQWAVLEPLLPAAATTGRPSRSNRILIDGIRWRAQTGAPWRDLPPCYDMA